MRKTLYSLISAALLLSLTAGMTACNKSNNETTAAPAETTTAAETAAAETETEAETEAVDDGIELPNYRFTKQNFPRMDGSTATVPLAQAVAAKLLDTTKEDVEELCRFNRTTQSFKNLLAGQADLLIVGEPKASVFEDMKAAGFEYEIEEIATDALIFVVNEENPVDSLTTDQIRDIYTGKITNWKEVGGEDADIVPFQRNEGAGSQALMLKLVMQDTPIMEAPIEYIPSSMGDLMTAVKSYDNSANAIGYSVYYYANDMKMASGLKIIAVDGVEPKPETIRARKYPHLNAYYAVMPKKCENPGAKVIYDWLAAESGQKLVAAEGYVSVMDVSVNGEINADKHPKRNYTRLDNAKEGTLTEIKARNDYGRLYPYDGVELYDDIRDTYTEEELEGIGELYPSGYLRGFFDAKGRLVTDPVYNDLDLLEVYDSISNESIYVPFYEATKYDSNLKLDENTWEIDPDKVHRRIVSLDGSFVSEEYNYITACRGNFVIAKDSYNGQNFTIYNENAEVVFTDEQFLEANRDMDLNKLKSEEGEIGFSDFAYGEGYFMVGINYDYYYVDEKTKKLCYGPFDYAQPFSDGIAFVRDKEGHAYYMDASGKSIMDLKYTMVDRLPNGNLIAGNDDGETFTDVLTPDGTLIRHIDGTGYFSAMKWGFTTRPEVDGDTHIDMYDCNGNLLFSDEENAYSINEVLPIIAADSNDPAKDGGKVDPDLNAAGRLLTDVTNGKTLYIAGADSVYPFYTMDGTADTSYIQAGTYDEKEDSYITWLIDKDLNIVDKFYGYCSPCKDKITGKWYLIKTDEKNGKTEVLDAADLKHIADVDTHPDIYEQLVLMNEDDASIAKTIDGKEVFCYPRVGSLGN